MSKDYGKEVQRLMEKPDHIRNIGIIAHIDHGKTTFSDNLLAASGMMSDELAGEQLFMDYEEQEQERGITIYSANVSMIHEKDDDFHLINMIDTPGHVDFGGDVTRAMRAVDGAIVLIDAVEGVMPQTETVLRQALQERVKPVLFINKVDRMIKELSLSPQEMQEQFAEMIKDFNNLVRRYAEDDYKKWTVSAEDGTVAFGSALLNWGLSVPFMERSGVTFTDVIEMTNNDEERELAKTAPLHEVVFDMVVQHLPSPTEAQPYRIPKIWAGDEDSQVGEDMRLCKKDGELACIVTKLYPDPHAGTIGTARVFSGTIESGQEVYLTGHHDSERVPQVCIYKGPERISMDEVSAGNIIGLVGMEDIFSGETICDPDNVIHPFETISHIFDPVVTKSIEPKKPQDLPKLVEILRELEREDTTLEMEIDQDTGETLVSGLGELHIEAKVENTIEEEGIEIDVSPPIVVYQETCMDDGGPVEGKSPNKHNVFEIEVSPLPQDIYDAMVEGEIPEDKDLKKGDTEFQNELRERGSLSDEDIDGLEFIKNKNFFVDATKGVQYLHETMDLIRQAVEEVIEEGPLAQEPVAGTIFRLVDASLHEDAIHRGPAQVVPAVRGSIKNAMLLGDATLLEPKQILLIECDHESMGDVTNEVQGRRGDVMDVSTEAGTSKITAKLPVAESFGFDSALKSATGGKGTFFLKDVVFETLPQQLRRKTIIEIRSRKGLSKEVPTPGA